MNPEYMRQRRAHLNEKMVEADGFFAELDALDDEAYTDGAIDKKHKELMGLAISIATRCDECVLYYLDGCRKEGASRVEILEAVKIGVMAGGSVIYPNARFAFAVLREDE